MDLHIETDFKIGDHVAVEWVIAGKRVCYGYGVIAATQPEPEKSVSITYLVKASAELDGMWIDVRYLRKLDPVEALASLEGDS